ncbi:ephexin-1-like [Uloborus diversus]|uniref:ephexin-1-like n=1 Tax=Uloborus diversus TaxID=327109 RepID=UPI002409F918|nr:ephexin-1-like [Uloborus diversus]
MKSSVSSNQNSTLKRKKMKRYPSRKENQQNSDRDEVFNAGKHQMTDTISFTDSSDTLINSEVGNESTCDVSEIQHLYEPVYESLGNYLKKEASQDEDNCSISLSPDDRDNTDFMQCSLTSLESGESLNQEKEEAQKVPNVPDNTNAVNKKSGNKISQLKRHLSWTKNDIRLELSSKFNKIKIKKNGQNSTEIGVKVQEHDSNNTSPKKKTFIKCILRQKSASSIPVKRSPSPKKESAHFYVHLSMAREKQRPFSDSAVVDEIIAGKERGKSMQNFRKQSEPALPLTDAAVKTQCHFKGRKFSSGPIVQRPKTPPPLPPVQSGVNNKPTESKLESNIYESSYDTCDSVNSEFYTVLDEEFISSVNAASKSRYENDILAKIHSTANSRNGISSSNDSLPSSISTMKSDDNSTPRRPSESLSLCLLQTFQTDLLKSPFEEEPMYQFYQKDVQQRATLWYSADGSESEFEDDASSKLSDPDYQPARPPVLQSQMSAMDLVHGEGGQRTLWCEVPEVVASGILKSISSHERKIQEAMFEVITSEASYLKSLNFLMDHFVQCKEFSGNFSDKHVLDKRERHVLFSDVQPVRDVSASLLADLEKRWLENIILSNICDIIYQHASKYFSVYVKYCSNQLYQERTLKELKEKRPEFLSVLKRLESNPICQGLDMHSFLMLPMQRITRLPLLIDAIFHRLSFESPIYESCKMALATLNKLVAECNEGARKMERMEEMLVISQQIDFKECKGFGLLSASRWLVKRGELIQLLMDSSNRRTFGRNSRWCKIQLYLFLFTDLLVVTRKKSDDSYLVVDYCPRNMLQVKLLDENMPPLPMRLPSSYRNVFQLIMLNNREGKTVEMLLSCLLESDRTRWMNAVTPAKSDNPDEKIYEEWDCPQVQCTHAYNAQQPDELSLEEADVVNVFKKMSDGWFEGERIRDGVRGWFPSSHAVEIINSHVRARNLHQRYRLLMLSQTYLEEQYKAQAAQTKK